MVYETIFYLVLLMVLTNFIWELNTGEVYDCKMQQLRYWGGCGADGHCAIEDVKTASDINFIASDVAVPCELSLQSVPGARRTVTFCSGGQKPRSGRLPAFAPLDEVQAAT